MSATGAGTLGLMFGTLGGNILEVQLNALQTEGKLNILSSPSITTLDNQKAFTENGAKVPYVTEEVSSTGAITRAVKFEDVVLRLEITPHVIDGKNLKMKILVKKDEVDETETHKVQGNPRIIKKQTETSLIVQDGETIVISGLTKHKSQDSESGIPGLKDIPVLGWLFKGTSKSQSMEEVLIFITPTILPVQTAAVNPEGTEEKTEKTPEKGE
jgi:type IV pilus assembly protein PilQ